MLRRDGAFGPWPKRAYAGTLAASRIGRIPAREEFDVSAAPAPIVDDVHVTADGYEHLCAELELRGWKFDLRRVRSDDGMN
jgi:hypothetical protein